MCFCHKHGGLRMSKQAPKKTKPVPETAPESTKPDWRRSPVWLSLLMALATAILFAPVVRNEFVNYDDPDYVTSNPQVQGGLTASNIAWAFATGHASNWHPLTWMSHMLDSTLFGLNPAGHHAMSLVLHVINVVLVFLLLRRLTGTCFRSAFVAAVFAIHPLRVESVAWISERKDLLSGLFFFLTLLAYERYTREKRKAESRKQKSGKEGRTAEYAKYAEEEKEQKDERRTSNIEPPTSNRAPVQSSKFKVQGSKFGSSLWVWYGLALLFLALGLMSKPMLVTVPFVLLLLDYWPLGRISAFNFQLSAFREKIPFFALVVLSSVITFIVQREGGAVSQALSLSARIANAAIACVRYVAKLLWPTDLSVLYPHPGHWPAWQVAAASLLLIGITTWVLLRCGLLRKTETARLPREAPCVRGNESCPPLAGNTANERGYWFVGWFWFLGMLVPVIGLVQVGVQSMADRYTYLPMIGLTMMLTWGVYDFARSKPGHQAALGFAAGVILVALCPLTVLQVSCWQTSEKLFRRAVAVTKNNYLAYNNLGFYLSNRGQTEEAIGYYRESLKINPAYEDALNNLGHALAGQGKPLEAIPLYEAALKVRPNHVEVHNNLGNALAEVGKIDEAIAHYHVSLNRNPRHADAHNNLGIALAMKGLLDEAIPHFRQAIQFKPNYASAHSNLGNAYAVKGQLDEAIREYQECLRLNPKDAQAHNNLGNALAQKGSLDEAAVFYRKALSLNARNPEAHYNLGLMLLRQGKSAEALSHFQEALKLKPNYPEALKQLEALTRSAPGSN